MAADSGALKIAGGLLWVAWAVVLVANYRGAAEAMPTRWGLGPIWQEQSRGSLRLTYAVFGLVGLLLVYTGIAQLV